MEADKELKSIINSGRIPNAFLFEGPVGSGKLKSAIEFAQSLFMLNSSNNNLNANFFVPVKQCIRILKFFSFNFF